jgi:VanZ family protein
VTSRVPSAARAWIGVAGWMTLTVILSTFPVHELGPDVSNADKIGHAAVYAVLAFLCAVAWSRHRRSWYAAAEKSLAMALAFGALMELVQSRVGRDPSLADWLADAVGAVVGIGIWRAWRAVMGSTAEQVG